MQGSREWPGEDPATQGSPWQERLWYDRCCNPHCFNYDLTVNAPGRLCSDWNVTRRMRPFIEFVKGIARPPKGKQFDCHQVSCRPSRPLSSRDLQHQFSSGMASHSAFERQPGVRQRDYFCDNGTDCAGIYQ
jgi:hypothetical protein